MLALDLSLAAPSSKILRNLGQGVSTFPNDPQWRKLSLACDRNTREHTGTEPHTVCTGKASLLPTNLGSRANLRRPFVKDTADRDVIHGRTSSSTSHERVSIAPECNAPGECTVPTPPGVSWQQAITTGDVYHRE